MKLWQKKISVNNQVERFTIGKDQILDLHLALYDVIGSMAHAKMLSKVGLLSSSAQRRLHAELKTILTRIEDGKFIIESGTEDIHSQVEFLLTKKLGNIGKQVHTARSRNDQVFLDVVLFTRAELRLVVKEIEILFKLLLQLSEKHKNSLLPGYTHLQIAMPSSFGLWFGAYAESLKDDLALVIAMYSLINRNPLGSAAGYGTSLPIKRSITTQLLAFDGMSINSVYVQIKRGKTEKWASLAIASVAQTLSKMAMDLCLFMNQNFGFVSFPENLTTGSSIMPHKKNPDVFELIRGKCNLLQTLPEQLTTLTTNLPSGYHREFQLIKEVYLPSFEELKSCLSMMVLMLQNISIKKNIVSEEKYKHLFSVDAVNEMVKKGIPFREAYKKVGLEITEGLFTPPPSVSYTHEGSIGNLCNDSIRKEMAALINQFHKKFRKEDLAIQKLISGK